MANFLAQLFEEGYQYWSLNAHRSAIGSVHEKIDGEVGKHPLIARILKGVFNKRPPRPKYISVWDVKQVLAWFKSIGPSESLSLDLTIKTTMLLALTRPCRGADLAALELTNTKYIPEDVVFSPSHLSKQSTPSHHGVEFFFPYFKDDILVQILKVYEQKTSSFCSHSETNYLLRSFIGSHGPVSSSTVATCRWLKVYLKNAGVDTSRFLVRVAATSKASLSGLTEEDILKAADWSSEGVFQKFYYRPTYSLAFGSSVLVESTSTKSHVDMETEPSEV